MGKSTISMASFNSYVTNYQRVFVPESDNWWTHQTREVHSQARWWITWPFRLGEHQPNLVDRTKLWGVFVWKYGIKKKKNIGFMVMFRIGIAIARVIPHFRTNYSMGIYLIFVHSDRQTFTRVMNSFLGFSSIWKMRDISWYIILSFKSAIKW